MPYANLPLLRSPGDTSLEKNAQRPHVSRQHASFVRSATFSLCYRCVRNWLPAKDMYYNQAGCFFGFLAFFNYFLFVF
jgi:hypothetical protein